MRKLLKIVRVIIWGLLLVALVFFFIFSGPHGSIKVVFKIVAGITFLQLCFLSLYVFISKKYVEDRLPWKNIAVAALLTVLLFVGVTNGRIVESREETKFFEKQEISRVLEENADKKLNESVVSVNEEGLFINKKGYAIGYKVNHSITPTLDASFSVHLLGVTSVDHPVLRPYQVSVTPPPSEKNGKQFLAAGVTYQVVTLFLPYTFSQSASGEDLVNNKYCNNFVDQGILQKQFTESKNNAMYLFDRYKDGAYIVKVDLSGISGGFSSTGDDNLISTKNLDGQLFFENARRSGIASCTS